MTPARIDFDTWFIATFISIGDTLSVWVFEESHAARRFYERHGFELVRTTDGSETEERTPDAEYVWQAVKGGEA